MRLGLKLFLIVFTCICVGFGAWHEYKMYQWRRKIPTEPLHLESHHGKFPDSVQVIFDRDHIAEKFKEAELARARHAAQMQLKKRSLEASRAQLKDHTSVNESDDFDQLCEHAYDLMTLYDESGFHWLVDQYANVNESRKRKIRRILFRDFVYLPGSWVRGGPEIQAVLRDQLRDSSAQSLVAARLIERAGLYEMAEQLFQLAHLRQHRLEQNLALFRSEPIGELLRIVCALKPDQQSFDRLQTMVVKNWQDDPRMRGKTTSPRDYDTLVKSLYCLTQSNDPQVVLQAQQFTRRLQLDEKFAKHSERVTALNEVQAKLHRMYNNHLRTDPTKDFGKLFSVVDAQTSFLRFRNSTKDLLLAYSTNLLLAEDRHLSYPLRQVEIDQLEVEWLFHSPQTHEYSILLNDRVFEFELGSPSNLAIIDVLNQILERQKSKERIAVFGEGNFFAFVCNKDLYTAIQQDLKLKFTDATNAVFERLKR